VTRKRAPLQVHDPFGTHVLDMADAERDDTGHDALIDAIDLASDQGAFTWITRSGKPVAAIVPVDSAEDILVNLAKVLAHVRQAARKRS
jgi:hypothetical protein